MAAPKTPKAIAKEIEAAIDVLHRKAREPSVPVPQRLAARNRAQELRDQLLELEASRFNTSTDQYKRAAEAVSAAIADLKKTATEIQKMIKALEKAQKVFAAMDKLLSLATDFAL